MQAFATTQSILETKLQYARIDMLSFEDRFLVSEVEITEPYLYFPMFPNDVTSFAKMLERMVKGWSR